MNVSSSKERMGTAGQLNSRGGEHLLGLAGPRAVGLIQARPGFLCLDARLATPIPANRGSSSSAIQDEPNPRSERNAPRLTQITRLLPVPADSSDDPALPPMPRGLLRFAYRMPSKARPDAWSPAMGGTADA